MTGAGVGGHGGVAEDLAAYLGHRLLVIGGGRHEAAGQIGVALVAAAAAHQDHRQRPRAAADRCFSPSNAEAVLLLPRFLA